MVKQIKQYDYSELTQLDTDELLKVYNRTAERLNKQITRAKQAGIYDEASAIYDTKRAPVYRSAKAKDRALQNVEQLTEDILKLQERSSGELTTQALTKEVTALKTDVIVMLKGSLALINRQKAEIERLKEERDMAVKDIYCSTKCFICKNMPSDGNMTHCPNYSSCGLAYIYFKWRGENNGNA